MCSGWVEAEWRISRLPNKMVISHFWEVTRGAEEEYQYQETPLRHPAVSLVTAPLSLSAAEAVNWLVSAPASAGLARCRGQPCRGVMNAMFISEMGLFLRNLIKYLNVWLLLRWSLNTSCRIYLCIQKWKVFSLFSFHSITVEHNRWCLLCRVDREKLKCTVCNLMVCCRLYMQCKNQSAWQYI